MKRIILIAILVLPVLTLVFWVYHGLNLPKNTPLAISPATNAATAPTNEPPTPAH